MHGAAFLGAQHQPGFFQHAQVLHEARQRHAMGLRELAHRGRPMHEPLHHLAPRAVGQRGKNLVEHGGTGGHRYMPGSGCSMLSRLPSVSRNDT